MNKSSSISAKNKRKIPENALQLFNQVKENSSENNMLRAAIATLKLHNRFNYTPNEIVEILAEMNCKISKPHIYNHFKLAGLPAQVKAHIRAERIQPTRVLFHIHKHQDDNELIQLVETEIAEKEAQNELKQKENKIRSEKENQLRFIAQTKKAAKKLGIEETILQAIVNLTSSSKKQKNNVPSHA